MTTLVNGIDHLLVLPSNAVLINSITLCFGATNSGDDEKVAKLDLVIVFFCFGYFLPRKQWNLK